jgi:hypothetical protein
MIDAAFSLPPVGKSVESTIRLLCSIKARRTCVNARADTIWGTVFKDPRTGEIIGGRLGSGVTSFSEPTQTSLAGSNGRWREGVCHFEPSNTARVDYSHGVMMKIKLTETQLTGKWLSRDGRVVGDETCQRIEEIIASHLKELGRDPSGWDALYRDPDDGRLWELTYPQGHLHGGGPPQLHYLRSDEAKKKYGAVFRPRVR